ncbi:hypothetical protein ACFL6F_02115 [Planctomycetota bacterium]
MGFFADIIKKYTFWKYRRAFKFLEQADSEQLVKLSQENAVAQFRRTAARVPFYKKWIEEKGINPGSISDIGAFQEKVPLITKEDAFKDVPIKEICIDGSVDNIDSVVTSSGYSGLFSIGINTRQNSRDAVYMADAVLEYMLRISQNRTMIINVLPMGVKIPTSLPCADVSVRSDMALALLNHFNPYYDQFLLIGDPHFLKKLIEEGAETGMDWEEYPVNLIIGDDWFPESMRDYFAEIIKLDPDAKNGKRIIASTFGAGELGLNLFHETRSTIQLRRCAEQNPDLKEALFGDADMPSPILFQYYPHRTFVEINSLSEMKGKWGELVVTMLDDSLKIPLVRYNTQDAGIVYSYNELADKLKTLGYESYIPKLHLPLVCVGGRVSSCISGGITSLEIRSLLYSDKETAASCTGQFKLSDKDSKTIIEFQLKKGVKEPEEIKEKLSALLQADAEVITYPENKYPYGMEIDYERKFRH